MLRSVFSDGQAFDDRDLTRLSRRRDVLSSGVRSFGLRSKLFHALVARSTFCQQLIFSAKAFDLIVRCFERLVRDQDDFNVVTMFDLGDVVAFSFSRYVATSTGTWA